MGGSSKSSSTAADNRLVTGEGSLGITGSKNSTSISSADSTTTNTTVHVVDGGAVSLAEKVALLAEQNGARAATEALLTSVRVGRDAEEFALDNSRISLAFADAALRSNQAATDSALSGVLSAQRDTLDATASGARDVIAATRQAQDAALEFTKTLSRDALAATRQAQDAALAVSSTSTKDALALATRSQGLIADSAADVLGFSAHVVDRALSDSRAAQDTVAQSVGQVANAFKSANAAQVEKSTTDSRFLTIAAMAVVGVVAFSRIKG